ncbi:MAG: gluconate 2-dehydrogenase subunit 3 family protein [Vicinamibacterales bacterium]
MQRRKFIQALALVPATTELLAQTPAVAPQGRRGGGGPAGAAAPAPPAAADVLEYTLADDVAEMVPRLLTVEQFSALKRLGAVFWPASGRTPGADECHAAEFLDFHLSKSPADRQQLYQVGLDGLNASARKRYQKSFAQADDAQAFELLAPMRRTWSYSPSDPVERMLRTAYRELRTATQNSREFAVASGMPRSMRVLRPLD